MSSTMSRKNALLLSVFLSASSVVNVACARGGGAENSEVGNTYSHVVPSEVMPIAGRNRRRATARQPLSVYPRANEDRIRVAVGANKLRINVLANDRGSYLRVAAVNPRSARGGSIYLKNNRVIYMPLRGYRGNDSFWYTVIDRSGYKHSAKVMVCVCDN